MPEPSPAAPTGREDTPVTREAPRPARRSPRRVVRRRTLLHVPTPGLADEMGALLRQRIFAPALPPSDGADDDAEEAVAEEPGASAPDPTAVAPREQSALMTDVTPVVRPLGLVDFSEDLDRAAEIGQRSRVIRAMQRGLSAREALIEVGLPETRVRWAQKLWHLWQETGRFTDGRWTRVVERTKLTPVVEQLVLHAWNGRRRAGATAIHRMIKRAIDAFKADAAQNGQHVEIEIPSPESVRLYLQQLPKPLQMVREGGMALWSKQGRPFVDYDPSEYANHIAQIDHTRLKIWIRVEVRPGVWEARVVWLTVVLDVHSRAVMGYHLSTRAPDQWSMALALRDAILPRPDKAWPMRGIPEVLVPDQGSDFMSHAAARTCETLGMKLEPTPPYYPDMKAEIERFFGTLNSFLSELVGFMPADGRSKGAAAKRVPMLLTFPQLRAEVERAIAEYHARPHAGIDDEKPAERWLETVRNLALPATEEDLNLLLLKDDVTRTVTKAGIRFTAKWQQVSPPPEILPAVDAPDVREVTYKRKGRYWSPVLMDYLGLEVRLAYNPEDLESVMVYAASTGEWLCEAWLVGGVNGRYSKEAVVTHRAGYRKGLKERTTEYAKEVERDDRRSARAQDAARALATALGGAALAPEQAEVRVVGGPNGTTPITPSVPGSMSTPAVGPAAPAPAPPKDVRDLAADLERRARGEA